jgi:hypothetical protein
VKKKYLSIILTVLLTLSFVGSAFAYYPSTNPGVIPNSGKIHGKLNALWWQWAYSFPLAEIPFFNAGGPVDISAGQTGNVWFLAGEAFGMGPITRSGEVPSGTSLFFPMANLINDYPCPDPNFEPEPGESLEEFLQRTGNEAMDAWVVPDPSLLFAEVDGVALTNLDLYRSTSSMFMFTADPDLVPVFDPCITGTPQYGVAVAYSLYLPPLPPGPHTLHFGYGDAQDITYELVVTAGP